MILLSKVFPTLDCASCISTPKMAATIHHPNIDVLTYAEVEGIRDDGDGGYHAKITQKPKFVDEAACTGCRQCEMACNVAVPDEFNADMVSRRAAYIAFPQAVPKKAVIERAGVSPCTYECPAGIKAHGYVARVRSGEYEKAFDLVLETTPLVGWLGRACYAPCEEQCTRGELEGPLPIRRLKRFIADTALRPGGAEGRSRSPSRTARRSPSWARARPASPPPGSSPARATASRSSRPRRSRAACSASASRRTVCPNDVVDDDIANVTGDRRRDRDRHARRRPRPRSRTTASTPCCVATGTHKAVQLRVPGEDLGGIQSALDFLARRQARRDRRPRRQEGARGRRRQRRHRRGAHGAPPRRRVRRPGQPRVLRGDARPRLRGRRGPGRGHHPARRLGHRPLRGRRPRAGAPSSRSAPASSTTTAASHPSTTRPSATPSTATSSSSPPAWAPTPRRSASRPTATGTLKADRRHAADGRAARLRRRRRRHRPDDDHHAPSARAAAPPS